MMRILTVCLLSALQLAAQTRFNFETAESAEVVAELDLRAPEADWAKKGREAAVALLKLDGKTTLQVLVPSPERATYRVFLGRLNPGSHDLTVERDENHSASLAQLEVAAVRFHTYEASDPLFLMVAHAPVLFARLNTVGRFSDVPLLVYCEQLQENGQPMLQYTVVFSNEDGGTSTRALMARWGRSTDIEYVYRVLLKRDGTTSSAIVQGRGHKDTEFKGAYESWHPMLMPVTDNNMIAEAVESPIRFQIAPVLVDLRNSSREIVMDSNPFLYEVMAKELQREGKIRNFGTSAGEDISDPRNYAYVEYSAAHSNSAFVVDVVLRSGRVHSSDLGRIDFAIGRKGWVRTAIEMPPGTRASDIGHLGFRCVVPPPEQKEGVMAHSGTCTLERVNKLFLLSEDYTPGLPWFATTKPVSVPTGQSVLINP